MINVINYHITSLCNYHCKYCFVGFDEKSPTKETAFSIIEAIHKFFVENGINDGRINFAGGEPLLYPHLTDVIEYANSLNLKVSIITNGSLLTEKLVSNWQDKVETIGISIDASISSQLIQNIFEHNTPLHDGAMIVRDNRIVSATCYLPLSDNTLISKELGTRHRAALGISEVTDCKVLVVSEETGAISMAVGGQLYRHIDGDFIRRDLIGDGDEKKARKKPLRNIIGKKGRNQ
jgi:hypothetical protein